MIKDFFDNIFEYTKSRLTNPFFGTLISVWLIRNFIFVYALFNFAEGVTLTQKVDYIRKYFAVYGTWSEFVINILISFLILFGAFVLLLMARLITNIYSSALNWLNSKTAKNTMTENETHNALRSDYDGIKEKLEKLKNKEVTFNKILEELNEELLSAKSAEHILRTDIIKVGNEKSNIEIQLSDLKKDYDQIYLENNDLLVASADKERLAKIFELRNLDIALNKDSLIAFTESYLLNNNPLKLEIRRDLKKTVISLLDSNLWKQVVLINLSYDMALSIKGSLSKKSGIPLIELNVLESNKMRPTFINDSLPFSDLKITQLGIHSMNVLHSFFMEEILRKKEIDIINFDID